MSGSLIEELGFLDEMRFFETQGYDLTGTIPNSIGTNWSKVTAFLVNWNQLDGTLPFANNNQMLGTIFMNGNNLKRQLRIVDFNQELEVDRGTRELLHRHSASRDY